MVAGVSLLSVAIFATKDNVITVKIITERKTLAITRHHLTNHNGQDECDVASQGSSLSSSRTSLVEGPVARSQASACRASKING